MRKIVDIQIVQLNHRLKESDLELVLSDSALDYLASQGFDREYGARPLRRIIQQKIQNHLAEGIIDNRYRPGTKIYIDCSDDKLQFTEQ